ncbi:MAG: DUF2807 domain-containing protein [Bacteroidetes bacterium]|nr:DUF2807 domain-containing protein [Bacteroidota bacterium]
MKKPFLFLFLLPLCAALSAQDRVINDDKAEARNVPAFHAIKIATGIHLILKQGDVDAVAVRASDKETRDRIKTEVVDGVLKIYLETKLLGKNAFRYENLKAYVSFRNIDEFIGSSGSITSVDGMLDLRTLHMDMSSGARFNGQVNCNEMVVTQSSGAKTWLSGKVLSLQVHANSGGAFYGFDLAAGKCDASATSGGKMEVSVSRELLARANSGGKIGYKGEGVISRMSTGSGGKIYRD